MKKLIGLVLLLILTATALNAQPVLLRDEFTSSTGTSNNFRSPTTTNITGTWQNGQGTWTIQGNHLEPSSTFTDGDYQTIDVGRSDVTISSLVTGFHTNDFTKAMPGILFRYVDANNFWVVQMDTFNGNTVLYERTSGTYTLRATIPAAMSSGNPIPLTVTAIGSLITIQLSGQSPVQHTSTVHQSATKVGVRAGNGSGTPAGAVRFDDFTVLPAFSKDSSNPLIQRVSSTWESADVAAPEVFRDAPNSRYVMVYSGFNGVTWRTGLAYSTDLITWTKETTNPVFAPVTGEGYIAASASIIYKSGTYFMLYQGAPNASAGNPANPWRVYAASSTNLLSWTRLNSGNPVLPLGAAGTFDRDGQHDPTVRLRSDGVFEVFFSGSKDGVFTAGHATSSDFTTWSTTAQLSVQGQFGAGSDIGNLGVSGNDPACYSLYFTHTLSDNARYINRADTRDGGVTFAYLDGVLYKSSGWESAQVFDPAPLTIGTKTYLFYAGGTLTGGAENLNAGIGVAKVSMCDN